MTADADTRGRGVRLLGPLAGLTGTEALARLLSFGFYLLAAAQLSPAGFGVVRYSLALVLLVFGPAQVLCNALTRELGASSEPERRAVLGTGLLWFAVLVGASAMIALAGAAAGLTSGADSLGLVVAFAGYASFQLYFSIARGIGDIPRAAASYAGASLVQLLAFAALVTITDPTPRTALIVFGCASLLPIALCELRSPVLRDLHVERGAAAALWTIGAPLAVAQLGYVIWSTADQIWVQHAFGATDVGLYAGAKTLTQIFAVLPSAITGVLVPQVAAHHAAGDRRRAVRLTAAVGAAGLAISVVALALLAVARDDVLLLLGSDYQGASGALIGLAVAMTIYVVFATLAAAAIGWGRPQVFGVGIVTAAVSEVALLATLGGDSIRDAAWCVAAATLIGCLAGALWALRAAGPRTLIDHAR